MSDYHLPEGWGRKLQDYRDAAGESTAKVSVPNHAAAMGQVKRFSDRLADDERRMRELLK